MRPVGVVGTGLIGRSWAIVFARAGHPVYLYDAVPEAAASALALIAGSLEELVTAGLIEEPAARVHARISIATTLGEAVADAELVQESTLETVEGKRAVFAELDALARPTTILASSTSTIPASVFSASLPGRSRCLVAHPVNPPHLVPLVELAPSSWTDPAIVAHARSIYEAAGQVAITVIREIQGFILNRLQAAVLAEAFRLVEDGYVSAEDLDRTMRDGLGLRWCLMGPFETIDLNAPGGLIDFVGRYGALFDEIARSQVARPARPETVARIDAERRAQLPLAEIPARADWRDRRLARLLALKRSTDS